MITLAITHFNRPGMLAESYQAALQDDFITEILILDDHSDLELYKQVEALEGGKVRVVRQAQNRGMMINKKDAIALAKNEWVIIFDSDNRIEAPYLECVKGIVGGGWAQSYCFYVPSFAYPNFDYQHMNEMVFSKTTMKLLETQRGPVLHDPMFWCLMNTCNMLVNKTAYLKVFEDNKLVKETDTLWVNYLWLKAGNHLMVVPGMHYFHRVHDGSGWLKNANYNMHKADEIKRLIMDL